MKSKTKLIISLIFLGINFTFLMISIYYLNLPSIDNGSNNQWDNDSIGNYWSDYSGVDANDDGIGDTPYIISGDTGSQDSYPIWDDGPN